MKPEEIQQLSDHEPMNLLGAADIIGTGPLPEKISVGKVHIKRRLWNWKRGNR